MDSTGIIEALIAQVAATTGTEASAVQFINELTTKQAAALAEIQAQADQLAGAGITIQNLTDAIGAAQGLNDQLKASTDALAAAITVNP